MFSYEGQIFSFRDPHLAREPFVVHVCFNTFLCLLLLISFRKDRMVLKVADYQKPKLLKEIEQEKKNMMYCMKPAVSVVSRN